MNYTFMTKNYEASESLKKFTTDKMNHLLSKFLPEDVKISVLFSEINYEKKVEVTLHLGKRVMRAEMSNSENMHAAIDQVVDVLKTQLRRYKNRLETMSKKNVNFQNEFNYVPEQETSNDSIKIERTKSFAIKPMDAEEAAMEIELLGHNFYVFLNSDTEEVNVIYKRKNGSYGLIEPKY